MKLLFKPDDQRTLKMIRIVLVLCLTISFFFVVQAMIVELHKPGTGEQTVYASAAYVFMGLCCLISVPLWIHKIKAIKSFQDNLNETFGDDEIAKNHAIRYEIKKMIIRGIPQIAVSLVGAVIIYYFVTIYIITPELKSSYIDYFRMQYQDYNYSDFNFTYINNTISEGIKP